MPIYEYQCKKCGYVAEMLKMSGEKDEQTCPKCGSERMEKILSSFGISGEETSSSDSCPTGTCPLS